MIITKLNTESERGTEIKPVFWRNESTSILRKSKWQTIYQGKYTYSLTSIAQPNTQITQIILELGN